MGWNQRAFVCWTACFAILVGVVDAQEPSDRLKHRWEVEPQLAGSWLIVPPKRPAVLDAQRLLSSSAQVRLSEARKAVLLADDEELVGRDEALAAVVERLRTGESNRQVLLAMVAAATKLSGGKEAAVLWEAVQGDVPARFVVEKALARWKSDVAQDLWLQRIANPNAPISELLVAIEGVGAIGATSGRDALEELIRLDAASIPVKVVASGALGALVEDGLEAFAGEVLASDLVQRELMAAKLLAQHSSDAAIELQTRIVDGSSAPAQAVAFEGLAGADPARAYDLAKRLIEHPDNTMRLQAIRVLEQDPRAESVRLQAKAIQDRNPTVRETVRKNLFGKAQQSELRPVVDEIVTYLLSEAPYPGVDQAILLAAALKDESRCRQFVGLLRHPNPEVNIRAAWALQELVREPDLLRDMLSFVRQWTDEHGSGDGQPTEDRIRFSFLFEAFGRQKYEPAQSLLRKYVPKHSADVLARASAIWALGKIYQDQQRSNLARQLTARMLDDDPIDPEEILVQFASAVALGYIRDPASRSGLVTAGGVGLIEKPVQPIDFACRWSIERIDALDRQ